LADFFFVLFNLFLIQMPATQTPIVVTMPADSVKSPAPAVTVAPEVQTNGGQPSTVTMGIERPSNNPVVNRSEIERVAASLKRVPPSKQNKSVHFTVGADARIRDDDGVPEDRRGSDPV
jgi:biopolymer transport protein ExbD